MAQARLTHASRAMAMGHSDTLINIIARSGFWDLPLSSVLEVAAHLAIPITDKTDEAGVLDATCKRILGCADSDMLAILERRLGCMSRCEGDAMVHNELLQCDEAQVVLDTADKKMLQKHNEEYEKKVAVTKSFAGVTRARRERAQEAAQASAKVAKKRGNAKSAARPPWRAIPEGPLAQPEAKAMMPPFAFIWRPATSNSCCPPPPPP